MAAATAAAVAAALAGPASASWLSSAPTQSATYSTGGVSPATGLTATAGCDLLILAPVVDLAWAASPSSGVTGYEIRRSTDGTSYSTIATVSGRLTTSFRDSSALGLGTTYWYRVRAVQSGWHTDSATASATTPTLCL